MSFKVNSSQQISFNDSVFSLTAREKKALDNSWAKIFADEIFPNIDEERFSVLYSSKASRPNAPVNVIIGALIIKEWQTKTPYKGRRNNEFNSVTESV